MASESEPIATSEIDIWHLASRLLHHHGGRALIVATNRAKQLGEREDWTGAMQWLEVSRAVVKLKASQRAAAAQSAHEATASTRADASS